MAKKAKDFGSLTFSEAVMRRYLSRRTYAKLRRVIQRGEALDLSIANQVADAMKRWALEKGATHYAHWFQPLTGLTSEKHESFITPRLNGTALLSFTGNELIQSESDASSFPSGGLRQTFEARGYTAWDPTSPAFIKDEVLCIPTAFFSYTKEALDKKTPLLRSLVALDEQAKRVLALFGKKVRHIECMMGPEQEYFLIKKEDFKRRDDLRLVGRTLFGATQIKGQELNDHYFGSIVPEVNDYMKELDHELWLRGVPATTKHNEVAPCQHELAPMYERVNVAVDHNLLTMEIMKALAPKHGFACLLHEKPFAYINGSGKHNNWSIAADGKNLLEPGESPEDNLQFIVFLVAIIAAVDDHQDLLRASVGTYANDFRLGGDEAPPSIVSISLGDDLERMARAVINDDAFISAKRFRYDSGVPQMANILFDTSDRNRTSPFAFTGNKFEFRMPGSRLNLSTPNMILNTAVAEALKRFADELNDCAPAEFTEQVFAWIKRTLKAHERILFSKDGYSKSWKAEAKQKGLDNFKDAPAAFEVLIKPENIAFFEAFHVMDEQEVVARYVAKQETYDHFASMELKTMLTMVNRDYLPAMQRYVKELADEIVTCKAAGCTLRKDLGRDVAFLHEYRKRIDAVIAARDELNARWQDAKQVSDVAQRNEIHAQVLKPLMHQLRNAVDYLEIITPSDRWPVPSYDSMLRYGVI